MSDRWFYRDNKTGSRHPVVVDAEGHATKPTGGSYKAPNGKHYLHTVEREPQIVAADPGWYLLVAWWQGLGADDGDLEVELDRVPVIAFEADDYGDCFTVNRHLDCDSPVQRMAGVTVNRTAVMLCHPERLPEPDDAEQTARDMARDAAEEDRLRAERRRKVATT